MYCVNQHANPDSARFCQTCGTNQWVVTGPQAPYVPTTTYAPAPPYNGMAIASVVVLVFFVPIATPIAQIVLGTKARAQIRVSGEQGDGLALAGIIIGWLGLALSIIGLVVFIVLAVVIASHANTTPSTFPPPA